MRSEPVPHTMRSLGARECMQIGGAMHHARHCDAPQSAADLVGEPRSRLDHQRAVGAMRCDRALPTARHGRLTSRWAAKPIRCAKRARCHPFGQIAAGKVNVPGGFKARLRLR